MVPPGLRLYGDEFVRIDRTGGDTQSPMVTEFSDFLREFVSIRSIREELLLKPKIDAKQALDDIRSGLDDYALMDKYNLSAKGLQSLFNKLVRRGCHYARRDRSAWDRMCTAPSFCSKTSRGKKKQAPPPRRPKQPATINAKEAVRGSVRAGMSDEELMEAYRLTALGLRDLFDQLVKSGVMSQYEIDSRKSIADETVDVLDNGG